MGPATLQLQRPLRFFGFCVVPCRFLGSLLGFGYWVRVGLLFGHLSRGSELCKGMFAL